MNRKRDAADFEEEKKTPSPSAQKTSNNKCRTTEKGAPLTLDVVQDEAKAVKIVANRFGIPIEHAEAVITECRKLLPDDPAVFVCYQTADRIHQALTIPGPGRPCRPGAPPMTPWTT